MSTIKRSKFSSQRQNWKKIFSALVRMLETQQIELQSLVEDRKLLEDRIKIQHDRWISENCFHEDLIRQLKEDLVLRDMERMLDAAKLDLNKSLMQRENFLCQIKSDQSNNELQDFKELFSLISTEISDPSFQDVSSRSSFRSRKPIERTRNSESSNAELRRLRNAYEKLASERSCEVTALLAEKTFVWNQYNIMENDYKIKLRHERKEVELARSQIENLLSNTQQLESLNNEKDCTISALEIKLEKMEVDSRKLKDEIVSLRVLRKQDSGASVTPLLSKCTSGYRTCGLGVKGNEKGSGSIVDARKKASSAHAPPRRDGDSRKEDGSLKRKRDAMSEESNTPRLFTSSFKPPKLRSSVCV